MKHSTLKHLTAAVATTFALGAAGAASAAAALPPLKTQGEVQYLTGGVGEQQAQSIKQAQSEFPLTLEFVEKAKPRDDYVADVDVKVMDHQGKNVLTTRADGPFLLAKLPSGEYTVKATYRGHTIEKKVHVTKPGAARAVFVWNAEH